MMHDNELQLEHADKFDELLVARSAPVGSLVAVVSVRQTLKPQNTTFELVASAPSSAWFTIDATTGMRVFMARRHSSCLGALRVARALFDTPSDMLELIVEASGINATLRRRIRLVDRQRTHPLVDHRAAFAFDAAPNAKVGDLVGRVNETSNSSTISYTKAIAHDMFDIDETVGRLLSQIISFRRQQTFAGRNKVSTPTRADFRRLLTAYTRCSSDSRQRRSQAANGKLRRRRSPMKTRSMCAGGSAAGASDVCAPRSTPLHGEHRG